MATVASPPDQVVDLLQQLAIGSNAPEVPKPITEIPAVSSMANVAAKPFEKPNTPLQIDPNVGYFSNGYPSTPYSYGGYGQNNEWINYPRFDTIDAANSGSQMYHQGYGYMPYGAYSPAPSPVPSNGNEVHHYLYSPTHYYQNQHTYAEGNKGSLSSFGNTGGRKGNGGSMKQNPHSSFPNDFLSGEGWRSEIPSPTYLDPVYGFGGIPSPLSGFDVSAFYDFSNHGINTGFSPNLSQANSLHPLSNPLNSPHKRSNSGFNKVPNQIYPSNNFYGLYGNTLGTGYDSFSYNPRPSRLDWSDTSSKYRMRSQSNATFGYVNQNMDGLNELNRGPRGKSQKTAFSGSSKDETVTVIPNKDDFTGESLAVDHTDAKFFVIKSYSEDDVHKSIKYGVWASTPNGNKKLNEAYRAAKEKPENCPVFLFFSVNTSGQFVGVAEMVGPVDFDRTVDYWQQDKWQGCFSVKWHVIKDVQNTSLKHIKLENNDNKPVTNSRDTQEVELEQGIEILKIFKDDKSTSSILDDFEFYEDRERKMQEKKAKLHKSQKQIVDVKFGNSAVEKREDVETKNVLKGDSEYYSAQMNNA